MSKLSRRSFLGGAATSAAGFLTSVALPSAAHASDETPQKGDQTADLLVIGAGGAGLATAVSAAQHGVKNIIILEKMPFVGGNTSISGGGFNSVHPVRQGRQKIKDSPELHAEKTLAGGDFRAYPELVKTMTYNSYDAIQWLEGMGMKFKDDVYQIYGGLYPRCHAPFGSLGSDYIKVLKPQCDKEGVQIFTNSRVVRLFRENQLSGKVLGAEYVDKDGNHKTVKANKAVVVTTGGFGANPQMRAKYDPRMLNLTTTNLPCSTGDLIPLMEDIGADLVGMDFIQCNPGCPPGRKQRIILHLYAKNFIMVGPDAKRFIREDERRDNIRDAVLSLPKQTAYAIVDSKGFADLNPGHQEMARKGLETGDAWTANTIEELAEKMGLDPKALKATIDEFNAGVDAKHDKLGKAPRNLTKIEKAPLLGLRIRLSTETANRSTDCMQSAKLPAGSTGPIVLAETLSATSLLSADFAEYKFPNSN